MIPAFIIAAFNIILYFPTLFYSYVMDDNNRMEFVRSGGLKQYTCKKPHELISNYLYSAGTFGLNPIVDHAFTLALWIMLNILIYYAFGHNAIALGAALLCSCHPLQNQISIWLNGRRYLVCAILLMACMLTWPWSLPFYLASSLFQVTIFFAPVLFLSKSIYAWPALACIGVLGFIMKDYIKSKIKSRGDMIPCPDLKTWTPGRPIVVVKLFGFYFFKMIMPQRVQMVYPFLQMFGRTKEGCDDGYKINKDFYIGIAAIIINFIIFICLPNCYRPWCIFMFLSLLQWCALIPITQLVADRYACVPCIFMCFFISYFGLTYLPLWVAVGLFCLLGGGYIYSVRQVFFMYRDLTAWYDYHCYDDFSNLAVVTLKIGIYMSEKKFWQAQAMIENALAYYPDDYSLHFLAYVCCMIVGAVPLAKQHLDICRKNIYLGEDDIRKGELDDAELGIRAMSGEANLNIPPHMQMKKPQKG